MGRLLFVSILVLLFNIPFGYWRSDVKRFSMQWFLAIHLPVPFIIGLRLLSHIGFSWYSYVFMVGGFFLGQQIGGLASKWMLSHCTTKSSCLVMDLFRCARA